MVLNIDNADAAFPLPARALRRGPFKHTVIIPTIGRPSVVFPSFRALRDNIPSGTHVVVVINPADPSDGEITAQLVAALGVPAGCRLDVLRFLGPVGFGGANNAGLAYANEAVGLGDLIVFHNDDLRATPGWLESLDAAASADFIQLTSEFGSQKDGSARPHRPRAEHGPCGLVGPVTTVAAGLQGRCDPKRVAELGHPAYAREWRERVADDYLSTEFLSGYCFGITLACASAVLIPCPVAGYGVFDSGRYPVAGYEDNDLALRVQEAGYRLVIDFKNYVGHVGHQSFDAAFPNMQRGLRNRAAYLEKFEAETQREQRLVGLYRLRIGSVHELNLMRESLSRHASILDGVAVVLTNNPIRDMAAYPDWSSRAQLQEPEQQLLRALEGTLPGGALVGDDFRVTDDIDKLERLVGGWVRGVLKRAPGNRVGPEQVRLSVWTGDFNEREERNAAILLAHELAPDWLISIDGDEVLEDRLRRQHFDRYMTHPDPLVSHYDFAWLDFWNDSRHYRTDAGWGDSGTYKGGRHGRRMWRVRRALAQQELIQGGGVAGLHCGNVPDASVYAVRVTGARWKHFGYVRPIDRMQRFQRYSQLDPHPDERLIGGANYGHIISSEGMRLEFFSPHDGIALHMLVHAGEDPGRVAGLLDYLYALVDHIVLVWTDDASPDAPASEGGMSDELALFARLYKCDVLHARLRDERGLNFAAVRNAAVEHIVALNEQAHLGLGWGLYLDPDEVFDDPILALIQLRRMAQATETYGWIVQFENPTAHGTRSMSDSVRLHRLEPEMRLAGRVHESFDLTLRQMRQAGRTTAIRVAPFMMLNPGLADPTTIAAKIRKYADGLIAEVSESPGNGGAWTSLGLQLEAEGRIGEAVQCYQLACRTLPDSFVGYRAMMAHHLRIGLAFAMETRQRLSSGHPYSPILDRVIEFVGEVAPAPENPAGEAVLTDLSLPPLPPELLRLLGAVGYNDPLHDSIASGVRNALAAVEEARGATREALATTESALEAAGAGGEDVGARGGDGGPEEALATQQEAAQAPTPDAG